jgi:hypothetical protein
VYITGVSVVLLGLIFFFGFRNFQRRSVSGIDEADLQEFPFAILSTPLPSRPTPSQRVTEKISSQAVSAAASHTPEMDMNGWYIYRDAEAGFSFSYPPAHVRRISAGYKSVEIPFSSLGVGGHQGMSIQKYPNPDGKTVEEIARIIYTETSQRTPPADFSLISKPEQVEIAGYSATKMIIPSYVSEFLIFIDHGKFTLIIGPVHDAVVLEAAPEALDLFYRILSTLELTP